MEKKIGWPCVLLSSVTIAILRLKSHGPESCIERLTLPRSLLTDKIRELWDVDRVSCRLVATLWPGLLR